MLNPCFRGQIILRMLRLNCGCLVIVDMTRITRLILLFPFMHSDKCCFFFLESICIAVPSKIDCIKKIKKIKTGFRKIKMH